MNRAPKALFSAVAMSLSVFAGSPTMAMDAGLEQAKSTDFALGLFRHVAAANTGKNVLVSPYSGYVALSMTANGAAGTTRAAMAEVLGATGATLGDLNKHNQAVLTSLNSSKEVQLEIANAIYADKNTVFEPSFTELCLNIYKAEAKSEDFADPGTVHKINEWCNQKTHGKIKEIIEKLTPREKMVLLNSVYFKGSWYDPFEKYATRPQPFTLLSGSTKDVQMMHKEITSGFLRTKDFTALRLPYTGKNQWMYIFLPKQGSDFSAFAASFTRENWDKWMPGFITTKVDLSMPKYKVEFSALLNDSLKAMGMEEAFGDKADFKNMSKEKELQISRVLQKTFMNVNEEGTEAAAVTAVVMGTKAIMFQQRPPEFTVDHPFIVALYDWNTREILFLGSIVDPKSE